MTPGVWLAVDVGSVRIGVARSDPRGVLAVPVETVRRDRKRGSDLDRIASLVDEYDAVGVVVGRPTSLSGRPGPAVDRAEEFGAALAARIATIPVEYADERMTTVVAARNLSTSGVRGQAQRARIDQAAAVEILQSVLDAARRTSSDHT